MDIWSWICELPSSNEWDESHSPLIFQLANSKPSPLKTSASQSIQLRANRTSGSNSDHFVTFSVCLLGLDTENPETALWVSDTCPLSSEKPFLPLILLAKLGFNGNEDGDYVDERHFPSRIRVWVGPEVGSTYVTGLSLGRSTDNAEREMEMQRVMKGSFGNLKVPKVKAMARVATRTRVKNWRWDQDAEGNVALFDAILCDNNTGVEVATWKPSNGNSQMENNFRKRYAGANRPFTKAGGLVFAGDECGGGVGWRLGKEMEGSVLKWRIGCQVWLSYWPNGVKSSYFETRRVEWSDEVDLPLIVGKF
ncbi:hypothetical protein CsSME_00009696 [Camellia sinensis var. sinensis]